MTRGERIAIARHELGKDVTQERLAYLLVRQGLKVNRGWVANLESDRTKQLDRHEAEALGRVLHKPAEYFLSDAPTLREDSPGYRTDKLIPIRAEIYELLNRRKEAEGQMGSTEFYIETILLAAARGDLVPRSQTRAVGRK